VPEPKTKKTRASVDGFLESIRDEQRRADCRSIQQIMEKATASKGQRNDGISRNAAAAVSDEKFVKGFSRASLHLTARNFARISPRYRCDPVWMQNLAQTRLWKRPDKT
jgi:hypothetical protein